MIQPLQHSQNSKRDCFFSFLWPSDVMGCVCIILNHKKIIFLEISARFPFKMYCHCKPINIQWSAIKLLCVLLEN